MEAVEGLLGGHLAGADGADLEEAVDGACRCFFPGGGVTPTSKFVCVFPFPDGDARRHIDLSWFGQEKALRPAGGESLYYLAPKCSYRGEYKRGMKCGILLRISVVLCCDVSCVLFLSPSFYSSKERPKVHV